jgi:dUTP pyrophosphatase
MKHLFSLSGVVGPYSDVLRVERENAADGGRFVVVMRDGHRIDSAVLAVDACEAAYREFVAAWAASCGGGVVLQVKKLNPAAKLPVRSSDGASCFDICALEGGTIAPGQRALVKTGLQMAVPRGFEIQVRSRSGHAAKAGVFVLNSPGTVDSDYRGEVGIILQNSGAAAFAYAAGDRIAQIAVCPVEMCASVEVESLSETGRGAGGFGSTGVK